VLVNYLLFAENNFNKQVQNKLASFIRLYFYS